MHLVYGWGINDADYVVQPTVNGKSVWCSFSQVWRNMIERCHSKKFQEKNPTYIGCEVTPDWKYFMTFKVWMEIQDWEGRQLDKDLIGNSKLYSPETCCFIPGWLNSLFNGCGKTRGKWPLGVNYYNNRDKKFKAGLRVDNKKKFLGYFDTSEEAHEVYCKAKIEYIQEKMKNYPDQKIKEAVLNKANTLYGEPQCVL